MVSFLFFSAHLWNKASIPITDVLPFRSNNWVEYEHGTGMADFVHSILSLAEHVLSHTGGFVTHVSIDDNLSISFNISV